MNPIRRRILSFVLCIAICHAMPVHSFAMDTKQTVPDYIQELSELVQETAGFDTFGSIELTLGESEMVVDGETKEISEDDSVVPFIDGNGILKIPGEALVGSSVPREENYSEEALEEAGYDVYLEDETGSVVITEPYGLGRLIVKTKAGILRNSYGATRKIAVSDNKIVLQYRTKTDAIFAAEQLSNDEDVLFCAPDAVVTLSSVADGDFKSWGTAVSGAPEFMETLQPEEYLPQVVVAVLDTGIDMTHPALKDRIAEGGYDFVNSDADPSDDHYHGTHCAGIIAEATPKNVKLLPVKTLDYTGTGTLSVMLEGIQYAIDMGVDILSMSFGSYTGKLLYADVLEKALLKDIIPVAAAGNDGVNLDELPHYPASSDGVITVSATDKKDRVDYYSNFGSKIDFASPGSDIVSTVPGGKYRALSGTSMAAPLVSACIALLKTEDTTRTKSVIYSILQNNARDTHTLGKDIYSGNGVVYLGAYQEIESLSVHCSEILLDMSSTITLPYTVTPSNPSVSVVEFIAENPNVLLVNEFGSIFGLRPGETDVTVRTPDGRHSTTVHVRVVGDENLTFSQITPLYGSQRMLRRDGVAFVNGSFGASGYFSRSRYGHLFPFNEDPYTRVTDIMCFYSTSLLQKKDGTLWVYGQNGGCNNVIPEQVLYPNGTPVKNPKQVEGSVILLSDGTVWKVSTKKQPYLEAVLTTTGTAVTNVASIRCNACLDANGSGHEYYTAVRTDGTAYAWGESKNSGNNTVAAFACDSEGKQITDFRDLCIRSVKTTTDGIGLPSYAAKDFYILRTDGTLEDSYGTVLDTNVSAIYSNLFSSAVKGKLYALKQDGTVLEVSPTGTANPKRIVMREDGTVLSHVKKLVTVMMGRCYALCEDGTAWAWGYNGGGLVTSPEDVDYSAFYGALGVGWDDRCIAYDYWTGDAVGTVESLSVDGLTYANYSMNYLFEDVTIPEAKPVKTGVDSVLSNVTDVYGNEYQTIFVRSDGQVLFSGLSANTVGVGNEFSRKKTYAVYAVPMLCESRQVYLRDAESTMPYSPEKVQKIELDRVHMSSTIGDSFTLTPSFTPSNTMDRNITWMSSHPEVATVNQNGLVQALNVGVTVIRAYSMNDGRVFGQCILNVEENEPSRILLRSIPTKREYTLEDSVLDTAGGMITLYYNSGQVKSLFISPTDCSGYDFSKLGTQVVTVSFGGYSFGYEITVCEKSEETPEEHEEVVLSGVSWAELPTPQTYISGTVAAVLSVKGGVLRLHYSDGTTEDKPLELPYCSGYNLNTPGQQTVKVTYGGFELSFPIEVNAPKVTQLRLTNAMPVCVQNVQLNFPSLASKPQPMVVYYDNGLQEKVTLTKEMCSGYDLSKLGRQTVTVTYKDCQTTFTIDVHERCEWRSTPAIVQIPYGGEFTSPSAIFQIYNDNGNPRAVSLMKYMCSGFDPYKVGLQDILVQYQEYTLIFQVRVVLDTKKVDSISIRSLPDKFIYENLSRMSINLDGGTLDVVMQDGEKYIVPMQEGTVTYDYTSSALYTEATLTYAGKIVQFALCDAGNTRAKDYGEVYLLCPPSRTVFTTLEKQDYSGGLVYVKLPDGHEALLDMALLKNSDNIRYEYIRQDGSMKQVYVPGEYQVGFKVFRETLNLTVSIVTPESFVESEGSVFSAQSDLYYSSKTVWRTKPYKVIYCVGESLDVEDGQYIFPSRSQNAVSLKNELCQGFDSSTPGTQTITYTPVYEKNSDYPVDSLQFRVYVTQLILENEVPELEVGKCTRISAYFTPFNVDGREIEWTSGNESVATVDKYGRVVGVSPGKTTISAKVKGTDVETTVEITIVSRQLQYVIGDADGDGEITLKDVAQMQRYLADGWECVIDLVASDVNHDGSVNLKDVVLLKRHLAGGWDILLE